VAADLLVGRRPASRRPSRRRWSVPIALVVGARADLWGRKPLFLAGLAVLTIRGSLYPLSDNASWLVGAQLLDGVGAGIYGAIFPVIVADLMRGTGRFNVAQGMVITAHGIAAALSTTLAGVVVVHAGYRGGSWPCALWLRHARDLRARQRRCRPAANWRGPCCVADEDCRGMTRVVRWSDILPMINNHAVACWHCRPGHDSPDKIVRPLRLPQAGWR
jgi:hypothetical protein